MNNFHELINLTIQLKTLLEKEAIIKTWATKKKERDLIEKINEWLERNYKNPGINKNKERDYFGDTND